MRSTLLAALLLLGPSILRAQYPEPIAPVKRLSLQTHRSRELGVSETRTKRVRLKGSSLGRADLGIELVRSQATESAPRYYLLVAVVDTAQFVILPRESLVLSVDGVSHRLSGTGSLERTQVLGSVTSRVTIEGVSLYAMEPDLLRQMGRAAQVNLTLSTRSGVPISQTTHERRFSPEALALVRGFLVAVVDPDTSGTGQTPAP